MKSFEFLSASSKVSGFFLGNYKKFDKILFHKGKISSAYIILFPLDIFRHVIIHFESSHIHLNLYILGSFWSRQQLNRLKLFTNRDFTSSGSSAKQHLNHLSTQVALSWSSFGLFFFFKACA